MCSNLAARVYKDNYLEEISGHNCKVLSPSQTTVTCNDLELLISRDGTTHRGFAVITFLLISTNWPEANSYGKNLESSTFVREKPNVDILCQRYRHK